MSSGEKPIEHHLAHFDHFDPEVARDPHRVYEAMRAKCPVAHSDAHGGFWVVTRYADLQQVARDWETFSSENPLIARAQMAPLAPGEKRLDATFLTMDPPDHKKYRNPVNPWFTPAAVGKLEPRIRATAVHLIEGFKAAGRADFSRDYARPLAKETIAHHFGLTSDQMDRFELHSYNSMALDQALSDAGHAGVAELLAELVADRRSQPSDDVLTALLDMTVDDQPLAEEEIRRAAFVLLAAGFETAMNTISTSLWHLAQHPEARQELIAAGPGINPAAVQEFIRLFAPLASARTATRDAEVGGQAIKAGDRLLLAFPSGNRDDSDFEYPDRLVLDRIPNRHLAFGFGIHRCIGLHLAQLEIRVALEEILRHIPGFSLDPDGRIEWTYGKTQAWGPTTLPVIFDPIQLSGIWWRLPPTQLPARREPVAGYLQRSGAMIDLARLANTDPAGIALRDERVELTWAEVHDVVARATSAMLALPLGPERRIAVFAENAAETLLCHVAALFAGVCTVPVNFHLTASEAAYILTDSQASAVFMGPETAQVGLEAARMASVHTVIGWRCPPAAQLKDWSEWLSAAPGTELNADAVPRPSLLYTSGTTGKPKGAEVPPHTFLGGQTVEEHLLKMKTKPQAQFGTHLVVGPLYHTAPLSAFRLLAVGVPVVVMGRFDPTATLAAIDRWKVESSTMVPTHFVRLLQLPEKVRSSYDLSSLKLVTHTGSSCPVEVKSAMIDWWGPVFLDAYGATEVGATCQITSSEWLEHRGSVGRPIPPFTALILDEDGKELPANVEGKLYFVDATGRGLVYHGAAADSYDAHLAPGTFTLGEIGYIDNDGYVYITDRSSDMVVSGGVNVYPVEAEQTLILHPDVADVAVIGVPHPVMGEELKALVVPADPSSPPDEAALLEFCRDHLSHYKCPKSVDLVPTIGRSAMGKLNRASLRAPFWAAAKSARSA